MTQTSRDNFRRSFMASQVFDSLKCLTLQAVPNTSVAHGLHKSLPADVCHPTLTPAATKPVFALPVDVEISEAVAVVFRDIDGKPVHGGLFGTTPGGVVKLTLVDAAHGVDTSTDPAWVAFGMLMSVGDFQICSKSGLTCALPWSIVDISVKNLDSKETSERLSTPGRRAVYETYLSEIAPKVLSALTMYSEHTMLTH